MFGKPAWFREKRVGWGLVPVAWQGWAYAASWSLVLLAPFLLLVSRQLALESLIWLFAAMSLLSWDVREIRLAKRRLSAKRTQHEDVLYIGDDDADEPGATTDRFHLHWR